MRTDHFPLMATGFWRNGVIVVAVLLGCVSKASSQPLECSPSTKDCPKCDALELKVAENQKDAFKRIVAGEDTTSPFAIELHQLNAKLEHAVEPGLAERLGLDDWYVVRFTKKQNKKAIRAVIPRLLSVGAAEGVTDVGQMPSLRPAAPDPDEWVGTGKSGRYDRNFPCGTQWYLHETHVPQAWACGATGAGVIVAVMDGGFVQKHDELTLNFENGYNLCDPKAPIVENGLSYHGAGTACLIGARENKVRIQGIAYEAEVRPIQALCRPKHGDGCGSCPPNGNAWANTIAKLVEWAGGQGRRVVLSIGLETCCGGSVEGSGAIGAAIKSALASGIVVVVAAGNGSRNASCDDVGGTIEPTGSIVVGATIHAANARYGKSNFGPTVIVSAPGDPDSDLTCTTNRLACNGNPLPGGAYTKHFGGTSGAVAKVAGIAALMLQMNNQLRPDEVAEILKDHGPPVGDPGMPGGTFVNAAAAVAEAAARAKPARSCP